MLTVSRILSLRYPYALMAGNRDLRLDVVLQHFLSGVFLLSLLHIDCPDMAHRITSRRITNDTKDAY